VIIKNLAFSILAFSEANANSFVLGNYRYCKYDWMINKMQIGVIVMINITAYAWRKSSRLFLFPFTLHQVFGHLVTEGLCSFK